MNSEEGILGLLGGVPANADHLPLLVEQCQTRFGVLPFVGAGMSAPFGFPMWSSFLLDAAERAGMKEKIRERIKAAEYEEAASDLVEALRPRQFQDILASAYGDRRVAGQPLSGAVAELTKFPAGPILTTNFDRVLEQAFEQTGAKLLPCWQSLATRGMADFQQGKPILFKLHGDWDAPEARVLTLGEYVAAYGGEKPGEYDRELPVPQLLEVLLSLHCCLFLGCSLRQDRTVSVLTRIAEGNPHGVHYAVVERPAGDDEFRRRAAELADLNIRPIWYPATRHDLIGPVLSFLAKTANAAAREPVVVALPGREVPNNIPELHNATIARGIEVSHVSTMLEGARLVTITGVPGCGKSRLAIEVARAVAGRFDHGVWFIELASLAEEAAAEGLLPSRIAVVAGAIQQPKRPPTEALAQHLATGKHLLVLDNCEHLLGPCRDLVGYLLTACPELRIVATSRKLLKIEQEHVYPLTPLGIPAEEDSDVREIESSEAVVLFAERARQRDPRFRIGEDNATAIAALCRALDGIPLAVELAAARVGVVSFEQMQDLRNLTRAPADAKAGQTRQWKSLAQAIEWSYNLLDDGEKAFLRSLSVFDGGWTDEAAAAVSGRRREADDPLALDSLQDLLDSSLIVSREVNGLARFGFLEPIRQFVEGLLERHEREEHEQRHAEWFVKLGEQANRRMLEADQEKWLRVLQIEADNLRAALRWSVKSRNAEIGLRLAASLWRFSEIRGYLKEGRTRGREVLAIPGVDAFPVLQSKVLSGTGMLAYRQSNFEEAAEMFSASLAIEESLIEQGLADKAGMANSLNDLGNIAWMKGDSDQARSLFQRSLAIERELGNSRGVAVAHNNLGNVALAAGDPSEAEDHYIESLQGFQAGDNLRESAFPLNGLARTAVQTGDTKLANEYGEQSLGIRRRLSDKKGIGDTQRTLGWASIEAADYKKAHEQLDEGVAQARGVGDERGLSEGMDLFAILSIRRGQESRAVTLFAAADRVRPRSGYVPPRALREQRTDALKKARETLGEQEFTRAWKRGATLSRSAAIEMARAG